MKMKNRFKRLALLLAATLTLAAVTACGSTASTDTAAPAETTTETAAETTEETTAETAAETESAETESAAETEEFADEDVDGELILDHEEELEYAQFYSLTHYKGGYKTFSVIGGQEEYEYLIVPEGKSVPADLAEGTVVIQQPVTNLRVDSGTAANLSAWGGLDKVSNINTEADSIAVAAVKEKMDAGDIIYTGSYKEPDYEAITAAQTQLVIDTNMLDSNPEVKDKYTELNIPFIVTRNSKEVHPLGHSEWAKLYGAILGMEEEANAYFEAQVEKVNAVSNFEDTGKTVAVVYFSMDGTKVYARRGGDYMAAMVDLAGGQYIMSDFEPEETGVATITTEEFYSLCLEADVLINLNMAAKLYTKDELLDYVPLVEDFKAVQEGNVYHACDRFSQFTFDNASIIEDLNKILSDETVEETTYFTKMK